MISNGFYYPFALIICFFLVLGFLGPGIGGVLWWIIQILRWQFTFSNLFSDSLWLIWLILGIIFLPWTTIMYVIIAPGGIVGWDWL